MRKTWWSSLVVFIGSTLCLAAGAPVAVRVEVAPLRAVDDETLVEVVVQVAPEDRARVGSNAMVRLELDGSTPDGVSPLWAVKVAGDGTARIEVPWPPGEHDLRVEIMSPNGQDSGLWVGRVRIPRMPAGAGTTLEGPPGRETPVDQPSPRAVEAPPPATPGIAAAGSVEAIATPPAKVAAPPTAQPEPAKVAQEPSPLPETPPQPTPTAAETLQAPSPSPQATEVPRPTPAPTEAAPPVAPPPLPTPTPPLVEPLRGKAPSATPLPVVEPLRGAAPQPPPVGPRPAAPPVPDQAALEAWASADQGTRDLTVVVTREGDPAQDVKAADLRLEVDGAPVTIESVGDARSAPLFLGVAVDLSPERTSEFETIRRSLAPLTERAKGGRGRLFGTATGGAEGGASAEDASPLETALRAGGAGNLPQLIASSLKPFKGQRARTFLVVVTDGHGADTAKDEWQEAGDAAAGAGVPVLVMVLWDSDFSQRARKNLQQIAGVSGGQLFLVQGLDQMGSAVDRYGRALDAGVALRFQPPEASKSDLLKIAVTATEEGLEVRSAKTISATN